MNKKRTIKLPPGSGITGKSSNPYKEYVTLRKHSPDFNSWVKRTYGKQGAKCFYCSCDLSKIRINVEHVIPLSRGGLTNSNNMVISCAECNKQKGSKLIPKSEIKALHKNMAKAKKQRWIETRREQAYQTELGMHLSRIF